MKERPILFSGPMVKAILDGRKTMTRRIVKLPSWSTGDWDDFEPDGVNGPEVVCEATGCMPDLPCPYGNPGDRLWVRETWFDDLGLRSIADGRDDIYYRADGEASSQFEDYMDVKWRPSIFMPRWASRISLEITAVRVERLQDISFDDCFAEGIKCEEQGVTGDDMEKHFPPPFPDPTVDRDTALDQSYNAYAKAHFEKLWNQINGKKHPWGSNPWLWVIEFKKL